MSLSQSSSAQTPISLDEHWMRIALEEARKCLRDSTRHSTLKTENLPSDVPVGAICVRDNQIVSRGHNRREVDSDATAHAEVLAIREASRVLDSWRLNDVTLYVTLEPCAMCAGAIWLSRIERVVFGASDERAGACGSLFDIARDPRLNHNPQVRCGVLEDECKAVLQDFFARRRNAVDES